MKMLMMLLIFFSNSSLKSKLVERYYTYLSHEQNSVNSQLIWKSL